MHMHMHMHCSEYLYMYHMPIKLTTKLILNTLTYNVEDVPGHMSEGAGEGRLQELHTHHLTLTYTTRYPHLSERLGP